MAHPVHFDSRGAGSGDLSNSSKAVGATCGKCGSKWIPEKDISGFTCPKCGTKVVVRK